MTSSAPSAPSRTAPSQPVIGSVGWVVPPALVLPARVDDVGSTLVGGDEGVFDATSGDDGLADALGLDGAFAECAVGLESCRKATESNPIVKTTSRLKRIASIRGPAVRTRRLHH